MVHYFEPVRYHTTMGSHEPVLRVKDGDTVVTSTVDARGKDCSDTPVTPRGNPQTGPFHVEGAEPGDTLAVHLDRLAPKPPLRLDPPARGAQRARSRLRAGDRGEIESRDDLCRWEVDVERRTVTLVDPDDTRLGRMSLPLAPMTGCFGVAPDKGQAISTATSASHGGNMDYRGFVEGVTAYFPVFAPGALFHIGDGHAVQGDGEIVGTGVEISFDVQFTFRVLKGKPSAWPRGENAEYVFTAGNAPAPRPVRPARDHRNAALAADRLRPRSQGGAHAARPVRRVRHGKRVRSRLYHGVQSQERPAPRPGHRHPVGTRRAGGSLTSGRQRQLREPDRPGRLNGRLNGPTG